MPNYYVIRICCADPLDDYNDFCHIILVQPIKTVSYYSSVGNLLKRGYRSAVNRIQNYEIKRSIANSIQI